MGGIWFGVGGFGFGCCGGFGFGFKLLVGDGAGRYV